MESLPLCIAAGVVLFYQRLCCNSRFQIGLSTQRVWSVIKNDAIMTWLFQTVWTYAIPWSAWLAFLDLSVALRWRERLAQCSVIESSDGGVTKAVDKRQHYVDLASLSVFGSNFVLAKVRRGLISVHCSELRGVRFSEVRNVLVLW